MEFFYDILCLKRGSVNILTTEKSQKVNKKVTCIYDPPSNYPLFLLLQKGSNLHHLVNVSSNRQIPTLFRHESSLWGKYELTSDTITQYLHALWVIVSRKIYQNVKCVEYYNQSFDFLLLEIIIKIYIRISIHTCTCTHVVLILYRVLLPWLILSREEINVWLNISSLSR